MLPLCAAQECGDERRRIELVLPDVDRVYRVLGFFRRFQVIHTHKALRNGLEEIQLVEIVRALIDVSYVHSTSESLCRQVRSAAFKLRSTQPFERVHQLRIKTVFDILDYLDRGLEILLRRVILLGLELHDGEVGQRFCKLIGLRTVSLNSEFDDAFGDGICLIENAFLHELLEELEFSSELVFGSELRDRVVTALANAFFCNRDDLFFVLSLQGRNTDEYQRESENS